MTQMQDLTQQSLGKLLAGNPRALKALEASLEKQATRDKDKAAKVAEEAERRGRCPHCGEEGKAYTVGGVQFRFKPEGCCQGAIFDTAVNALKYALSPLGDKVERAEMAHKFKELEPRLTDPALRAELSAERERLKTIKERVIDSGRWPAKLDQTQE